MMIFPNWKPRRTRLQSTAAIVVLLSSLAGTSSADPRSILASNQCEQELEVQFEYSVGTNSMKTTPVLKLGAIRDDWAIVSSAAMGKFVYFRARLAGLRDARGADTWDFWAGETVESTDRSWWYRYRDDYFPEWPLKIGDIDLDFCGKSDHSDSVKLLSINYALPGQATSFAIAVVPGAQRAVNVANCTCTDRGCYTSRRLPSGTVETQDTGFFDGPVAFDAPREGSEALPGRSPPIAERSRRCVRNLCSEMSSGGCELVATMTRDGLAGPAMIAFASTVPNRSTVVTIGVGTRRGGVDTWNESERDTTQVKFTTGKKDSTVTDGKNDGAQQSDETGGFEVSRTWDQSESKGGTETTDRSNQGSTVTARFVHYGFGETQEEAEYNALLTCVARDNAVCATDSVFMRGHQLWREPLGGGGVLERIIQQGDAVATVENVYQLARSTAQPGAALHAAVELGRLDLVEVMVRLPHFGLAGLDWHERTPLWYALMERNILWWPTAGVARDVDRRLISELLVRGGESAGVRDSFSHPLVVSKLSLATVLADNVSSFDSEGPEFVDCASIPSFDRFDNLCEKDVSRHYQCLVEGTVLDWAITHGEGRVVSTLLESGATPMQGAGQTSSFHWAAIGHVDVLAELLKWCKGREAGSHRLRGDLGPPIGGSGSDECSNLLNEGNVHGDTPLHFLTRASVFKKSAESKRQFGKMVEMLTSHGADLEAENRYGLRAGDEEGAERAMERITREFCAAAPDLRYNGQWLQ